VNGSAALIVAAGSGTRFGSDVPKVFVDLLGVPLVLHSLWAFDACQEVSEIILAVAEDHLATAEDMCASAGLRKPWRCLSGGQRRQDTVLAGLRALAPHAPELIAIHDGARPLIDVETISRSVRLARQMGACVTAAAVTDTIKQVSPQANIVDTPDRSALWRAQTPQTFKFDLLLSCYQRALDEGWEVTDDASVVERCGHPVKINPAASANIKVTTPADLDCARALLRPSGESQQAPGGVPGVTIGHGYDVHALVEGRRLIVGGVTIPHERGLAGHSDADVLLHAVCDAILGAAGAGDIGAMFPDTDPEFEGADSADLLAKVAHHVCQRGFAVGNVDCTIIAQRPRMAPHIQAMRNCIATALSVDVGQVSVKATTTERLGFCGREEGIAAHAVALLARVA